MAIGMFFFSGLMYGENSTLPVINYWRWWLVHLWAEGFFEVFATVIIAYIFSQMKIISAKTGGRVSITLASIFLAGGIIGTLHHLYYSETPVKAIALGATFSALEVVPLPLMGFEIRENWNLLKSRPWMQKYKWPIFFFIAVAFWNNTKLKRAFWLLNIGLVAMMVLSLLPIGIIQAYTPITKGYSFAREANLLYSPTVQTLKWMRVIGDVIFSVGIFYFCWFTIDETIYNFKRKRALNNSPSEINGEKVKEPAAEKTEVSIL